MMGTYLKSLRRKFGVVTLVLGCCCLSGWIRSLSAWDTVISKGSDYDHLLRSGCGCIQFQCLSPTHTDPQRGWYVQDPASSWFYDLWVAGPFQVVHWNYDFFGFTYRSSSSRPTETIRIDDVDHRFHEFTIGIPYWSIVIPLTLISAYLLLSKPRAGKVPPTEVPLKTEP